jgi:mannose-6-phosphate isomerase-like protein (cupin superfamily)
MRQDQHFCFESLAYEQVFAHGGALPILFKRVAERARGSACNFIDFSIVPPGADIGRHTHATDNEEIYIVVSGRGLMYLDGEELEVGPGHVIVNRPGGTHALKNTADTELRLVVVEVPTGSGLAGAQGPAADACSASR